MLYPPHRLDKGGHFAVIFDPRGFFHATGNIHSHRINQPHRLDDILRGQSAGEYYPAVLSCLGGPFPVERPAGPTVGALYMAVEQKIPTRAVGSKQFHVLRPF